MINTIKITEDSWNKIYYQLSKDYPSSFLLIREKMKVKLGFVVRRHREWKIDSGSSGNYDGYGEYVNSICLDFYDNSKKTFFLLKYSDLITQLK